MGKRFDRFITIVKDIKQEVASGTVIEAHSSGKAYITGCRKITVYTDSLVEMKCADVSVSFEGEKLSLQNLINGQICLTGKVRTVNFRYD